MTENNSYLQNRVYDIERLKSAKKRARSAIAAHPAKYLAPSFVCAVFCAGAVSGCVIARYIFGDMFPFAAAAWFLCLPVISGAASCAAGRAKRKTELVYVFACFFGAKAFARSIKKTLFASCALACFIAPAAAALNVPYRFGAGTRTVVAFEVLALFAAAYGTAFAFQFICEKRLCFHNARFYASFVIHPAIVFLTGGLWLIILIPYAGLSYSFYKEDQK